MKKTNLLIAVLIITAWASVSAQVSGNYLNNSEQNYQYNSHQALKNITRAPASSAVIQSNNEFTLIVNGLMNIVADDYVAILNVVQVAETIELTDQLMNNRINTFKQKLNAFGYDTNQVKVDVISFVPRYDIQTESKLFSKTYNEVPAGFELQKNISVHYNRSAMLDGIVTAATYAEIYDIVKVDYFVTDLQRELDSLRTVCLKEVKAKTKSFEKIGFKLDTLRKILSDNYTTIYPQTRYYSYQAYSRPSLQAAKKKALSQISINEAPKTTTKFYSSVDYDLYDLVINPVITEPVVQLSYSVAVKYFIKDDDKAKSTYYLVTPSGDLKPIITK